MIDLDPPGGSPIGNPPDKNPRSPRPDGGSFSLESIPTVGRPDEGTSPVASIPGVGRPEDRTIPAESMPTGDRPAGVTSKPSAVETGTDAAGRIAGGEPAAIFERFFDSFRRQLLECYGKRCDELIARAEEQVAERSPGFSIRAIGPANALSILDLVETMTSQAWVFKRRRLRRAALGAVSELYNTHYRTLEQIGAVERVEQFYYRLKK